jgi:holo-[acyl-carrier protein] synthase
MITMIIGTGIDIIEIRRIAKALEKPAFVNRVFTRQEREYCESRGMQRSASYAVRFAAKEAVLKAFGTGLSGGKIQDISITNDSHGRPMVSLDGYYARLAQRMGVSDIYVSLSHAIEYAAAQVIFWGGNQIESSDSSGDAAN